MTPDPGIPFGRGEAIVAIRICPERDGRCPHGTDCPFARDRYTCDMDGSREELARRRAERESRP